LPGAELVDAVGDNAQGIDVEAGVCFVHEGEFGFEHGHLQDLASASSPRPKSRR